ncbi:Cysteine--tRNA ligase, cytoplasmic [Trichinella pseudospiralis]|uniref:Cysteine--tRNA ligase, cytoplasmic n=2 Tax=Trichinella pseudospiralis TaxID=6337 RepID=A0A0V1J4P1_TRIPS|nr:Cysteine--tRNA ligase, cytoplasmic [Trichinella pseudospiralis]
MLRTVGNIFLCNFNRAGISSVFSIKMSYHNGKADELTCAMESLSLPVMKARSCLKLYNSLTRKKEIFIPRHGNQVNWYICGPTVYDAAHMGHARSYISFDILRRVLQHYFGYDVLFVMNITDIDDKIIVRARQRHLFQNYLDSAPSVEKMFRDVKSALEMYKKKFETEANVDKKAMLLGQINKVESTIKQAKNDSEKEEYCKNLANNASEVLSQWLDSELGSTITDHSIFDSLARHFEQDFDLDMAALNVLPPDVVTRVSEYIPEVVAFVDGLVKRGFAYEVQGSVYFDTVTFGRADGHRYGRLLPEAVQDTNLLVEGEGELSLGDEDQAKQKRFSGDFALWKASKPGEPAWPSPWGPGRPGWHIECSAMASAICGEQLDVHAGGFDLKFPHHDNELAQSEAYHGCAPWVRYFLHAGTLRIQGLKMSKSLKNFVTIKQALQQYTSRQIRLLFLMHNWAEPLDYSPQTMERALHFERVCQQFFRTVAHYLRRYFSRGKASSYAKLTADELRLLQALQTCKQAVHDALCDSVDTKTALDHIRELICHVNVYLDSSTAVPNCLLLRNSSIYVNNILKLFGASGNDADEIGFGDKGDAVTSNDCANESLLMPCLNALADFREVVRSEAKIHGVQALLKECDRLRDEILPNMGVLLEDRKGHTVVKLVDPETLAREREQKVKLEKERLAEKEKQNAQSAAKKAEKERLQRIPASELFRQQVDKYSAFDERGIPTHDADGELLNMDQIHDEFEKNKKEVKRITPDPDLPGEGQYPCIGCDRHFTSQFVLMEHCRSKAHKRRMKELKFSTKYTQKEAEAAGGLGTYTALNKK